MNGEQRRSAFEELGYVESRGFLDASAVDTLRATIERAAASDPGGNPLSAGAMRFASNIYRSEPELADFLASPAVVDLVASIAGPDLWVRWDQAVWKSDGAPEFPWHQDNGYTQLSATHYQLWVALTPMTSTNGGLLVCPGGHRELLPHRDQSGHMTTAPPGEWTAIDAEPGDVILFSSFLPHATTPHIGGPARLAYVAEYLPLDTGDASVEAPHLVVSKGGRARVEWSSVRPPH